MITLSSKSFAETLYYSGTYTEDIGGQEERLEMDYEFTLRVDYRDNNEGVGLSVAWKTDVPKKNEEVEKQIKKKYLER